MAVAVSGGRRAELHGARQEAQVDCSPAARVLQVDGHRARHEDVGTEQRSEKQGDRVSDHSRETVHACHVGGTAHRLRTAPRTLDDTQTGDLEQHGSELRGRLVQTRTLGEPMQLTCTVRGHLYLNTYTDIKEN